MTWKRGLIGALVIVLLLAGAVLGISERTVVFHVNNASHKLGCINKQQAVLKALRLGLID